MDKQRAKILIKKINSLFGSIEMEDGKLSKIERDLMLKYIRDLYEEFVETEASSSNPIKKVEIKPATGMIPPEAMGFRKEVTTTPAPPTTKAPLPTTTQAPPLPTTPAPTTTLAPPPPPTTTAEPVTQASYDSFSSSSNKINQLFVFKKAKELSEKLSDSPIRDLTNALSINDKLLYSNELFGRQPNILSESLSTLNRFESMDQAKRFLINIAEQYNWGDDERVDIARSFIKTIRRRYL
ncbi:MAG: hypothetical protein AAF242_17765 [Bacteroidota bacterium]